MRLADAASRFNRTPFYDGVSQTPLFYGQIIPFDNVTRDAVTASRRLISLDPTVQVPVTRLIMDSMGTWYIVGTPHIDHFMGSPVRAGYPCHVAIYSCVSAPIDSVLTNTWGPMTRCGYTWLKDAAYTQQTSHVAQIFEMAFSTDYTLFESEVIHDGTNLFLVRSSHTGDSGIQVVHAELLGKASDILSVMSVEGPMDPVTEARAAGTNIPCMVLRWQALFEYGNPDAPSFEADDRQVVVLKSDLPTPVGVKFTKDSNTYVIKAAATKGNAWICRATKVA